MTKAPKTNDNWVTRAQFAALIGAKSASYVNELERNGRVVRAPDKKHFLKAESLLAYHAGRDPSKRGVAARHAAARGDDVPVPMSPESVPNSSEEPQVGNYQSSRAMKEHFLALGAKRDYEISIGSLLQASDVERVVSSAMVELRQRLEGLANSLAPVLSAMSDESSVRATLRDEFEAALRSASHHFNSLVKI